MEVKPCPCCGGTDVYSRKALYGIRRHTESPKQHPWLIECRDCGIMVSIFGDDARKKGFKSAEAMAAGKG